MKFRNETQRRLCLIRKFKNFNFPSSRMSLTSSLKLMMLKFILSGWRCYLLRKVGPEDNVTTVHSHGFRTGASTRTTTTQSSEFTKLEMHKYEDVVWNGASDMSILSLRAYYIYTTWLSLPVWRRTKYVICLGKSVDTECGCVYNAKCAVGARQCVLIFALYENEMSKKNIIIINDSVRPCEQHKIVQSVE